LKLDDMFSHLAPEKMFCFSDKHTLKEYFKKFYIII
jgi:hypothetical protein